MEGRLAGKAIAFAVAVENSPCHDGLNAYRFSEISGKPGWFSVTASKLVNGKEIAMGTGEWKYHVEKEESENTGGEENGE